MGDKDASNATTSICDANTRRRRHDKRALSVESGSRSASNVDTAPDLERNDDTPTPPSPSTIRREDAALFEGYLHDYEVYVYPFHPIISVSEARDSIAHMDVSTEARAFVYGLVAVSINLTHSLRTTEASPGLPCDPSVQVAQWASRALEAMSPILLENDVTVRRITTVLFLHVCLMGLRRHVLAFYYLRQAVSMVQMLRVDDASAIMASAGSSEQARRERLYWEVFVHERFYSISEQRTVLLLPLTRLPDLDDRFPYSVHHGFVQIIRLFLLIDSDFLAKWFATFHGVQDVTPDWIRAKHAEIDAESAGNDEEVTGLSEMQQADLVITKHWLRMLVWQIAMSKCLLSSEASERHMSLLFPVRISARLRKLLTDISKQAIEVHGSGIQQKLFELTDTIGNVILTVPAASLEETRQRVGDFKFLYELWVSLPRPNILQKELLQSKLEKLVVPVG
ncbi:hypothetical protein LTR29_002166 [Friedmanniomyces endolithicus]|nr:hypothetical protein LTR29_002166 [Friedmanniomyces endolithicus]